MTAPSLRWGRSEDMKWLEWRYGGVTAAFPTREGGVSRMPWHSLNLGFKVGDDPVAVLENRRRFCAAIGVSLDRLVVPHQVHATTLRDVGDGERGAGAREAATEIVDCDGLITSASDLGLGVSTADCLPIVIVSDNAHQIFFAFTLAGIILFEVNLDTGFNLFNRVLFPFFELVD